MQERKEYGNIRVLRNIKQVWEAAGDYHIDYWKLNADLDHKLNV